MNPAVEWISRPRRPSELFPSRRATRSSGSVMRSSVEPSTNSPGWRMKAVVVDLDELGQPFLRLLDVDVRVARVVEHPKRTVDAHVDARRLEQRGVIRVDPDAAFGDGRGDGAVGQDHAAILPSARRRGRRVPSGTPPARCPSMRRAPVRAAGSERRATRERPSPSPGQGRRRCGGGRPGPRCRAISPCSSSSRASVEAAGSERPSSRARSPTDRPPSDPTWARTATCRRPSDAPSTSASSSGVGPPAGPEAAHHPAKLVPQLRHPVRCSLPWITIIVDELKGGERTCVEDIITTAGAASAATRTGSSGPTGCRPTASTSKRSSRTCRS